MANKINLLGANNELLSKATVEQKQTKSQFVQLPDLGLSEVQLFTQYQITTDKIGSGSFATIKVVKEHSSGKHFAIKYVKTRGRPLIDINSFRKEILFLSTLKNHPNIIKLYDFCVCQNGLYMVLEFCNGGDVAHQLDKRKRFHESEAKNIAKQVIAGLCYYHQHHIVHRDLKPDNLMYNNGVIKIIDFGLADECAAKPLTQSCGTALYAAPEVIEGAPYNTQADMWSFGVILFQLIAGHLPFYHKDQNKLMEIVKRGKFSFSPYFDSCHPSLRNIISQLLCMQTAQRLSAQQTRNHGWFSAYICKQYTPNNSGATAPVKPVPNNNNNNNSRNMNNNMRPQSRSLYQQQRPPHAHKPLPFNNNNNMRPQARSIHQQQKPQQFPNNNNNMMRPQSRSVNQQPRANAPQQYRNNNNQNMNANGNRNRNVQTQGNTQGFNPNMNRNPNMKRNRPQQAVPQPFKPVNNQLNPSNNVNRNHSYSAGNNQFNPNVNRTNNNQYRQNNYNSTNSNPHARPQQTNMKQMPTNNRSKGGLPHARQLNVFK
eukprot:461102_1